MWDFFAELDVSPDTQPEIAGRKIKKTNLKNYSLWWVCKNVILFNIEWLGLSAIKNKLHNILPAIDEVWM